MHTVEYISDTRNDLMYSVRRHRICERGILTVCVALLVFVLVPAMSWGGETLERIRSKGVLRCGVSESLMGFSMKDKNGRWSGFEADFCRAAAAAVLGSPEKVAFVPLSAPARFPALISGDVDLLLCDTTWTLEREALLDVAFAGTLYYDGQAFMVPVKSKARRVSELNGATICVVKGTTHVEGLSDYFGQHGLRYTPLLLEHSSEVEDAFYGGRCLAYTADKSGLAAVRIESPGGAKQFVILPDVISKEPLGPVVKRGDEEWLMIVKWVVFTLIEAEELGITRDNVLTAKKAATGSDVWRFLDGSTRFGKALGTSPDWTVQVIESVGNYGEMFERNLGALELDRGLNRLWTEGGLMYAPPFR